MSEFSDQVALLEWASTRHTALPELAYLFAVPNGGHRSKKTAVDMQRSGTKPGVPDLFLPVARHGLHGLWLEMKTRTGRVTEHQERWHTFLSEQDYMVEVCYGWQDAAQLIEWYLDVPQEKRTEFFR